MAVEIRVHFFAFTFFAEERNDILARANILCEVLHTSLSDFGNETAG
jgi:hypothetical protein